MIKNKVKTNKFEYEEEVKEFTGLIFHCPNCDEVFHLHIANVRVKNIKNSSLTAGGEINGTKNTNSSSDTSNLLE